MFDKQRTEAFHTKYILSSNKTSPASSITTGKAEVKILTVGDVHK